MFDVDAFAENGFLKIDEAAPRHEGYTIETFVDAMPDDLIDSLCVLLGQLAVDAPTGAVDFEEEVVTPQRYAEMVALDALVSSAADRVGVGR